MTDKDIFVREAIRTRYHGDTNPRIIATKGKKTVSVFYDHSLNENENHYRAAQALADYDDTFIMKVKKRRVLCFEGDYYWSWYLVGEKETNMSS
tara:strand:+ start:284 stop:565 length:282 start_codon:yes stop_codon:yes gene_type:complete